MKRLRVFLQRWIDRKTKDLLCLRKHHINVLQHLESAKTIGELQQRVDNLKKSGETQP